MLIVFVQLPSWTVSLLDIYLHISKAWVIWISSFHLIESLINVMLTREMLYEFVF